MKNLIYIGLSIMMIVACSKEKEFIEDASGSAMRSAGAATKKLATEADPDAGTTGIKNTDLFSSALVSTASVCGLLPSAGVTFKNGMLCFPNSKAFNDVYAYLDCQVENYTGYDAYMKQFNGDLYLIDSLLDAKGIDEDQPLADYEKKFSGYVSLRSKLNADEEKFLANGGEPGLGLDPDTSVSEDWVFNTLVNNNGCFKIGDTIVKLFPNGVSYLVTDGNLTTLSMITDYYSTHVFAAPNVIVLWNENTAANATAIGCITRLNWYTNDKPNKYVDYTYNGKSYRYFNQVKVTNVPFFHAYTSLSKNYIKKRNRWKKTRMYIFCTVQQNYKDCTRVDGCDVRFPNTGYIYRKHGRAIYKSNIFHIFNNGTSTNGNTLYIAGEFLNLRALNALLYSNTVITRKIYLE